MSRATRLAALPRHLVLSVWHLTFPTAPAGTVAWAGSYATKEQLVDQIVTEEESCHQQPLPHGTARTPPT